MSELMEIILCGCLILQSFIGLGLAIHNYKLMKSCNDLRNENIKLKIDLLHR